MRNLKKSNRGRPTSYSPKYARYAYRLAYHGANESEIASALNISRQTLNKWKSDFPELLDSICNGKKDGILGVKRSLYKRAKGYRYTEVTKEGTLLIDGENVKPATVVKTVVKHMAPDANACLSILKNNRTKEW